MPMTKLLATLAAALLLATGCGGDEPRSAVLGLGVLFAFTGRHGRFGQCGRGILAQLTLALATAAAAAAAALAALAVLLGRGIA